MDWDAARRTLRSRDHRVLVLEGEKTLLLVRPGAPNVASRVTSGATPFSFSPRLWASLSRIVSRSQLDKRRVS